MPWKEVLLMESKLKFVSLAGSDRFTVRELCQEFGVSRKTGHKWIKRYEAEGSGGLAQRSRSPKQRTSQRVERLLVKERRRHPTWGPKKLVEILKESLISKDLLRGVSPEWH